MTNVDSETLKQLPLEARLAWGASVLNRLTSFYSPYARKKYVLDEAIALSHEFREGVGDARARAMNLAKRHEALAAQFEDPHYCEIDEDGYPFVFASLTISLLNEILHDNSFAICVSASDAAESFVYHQVFRYGKGADLSWMSGEMIDDLARPAEDYIRATLAYCLERGPLGVDRSTVFQFPIAECSTAIPQDILDKIELSAPSHELAYIQEMGWPRVPTS